MSRITLEICCGSLEDAKGKQVTYAYNTGENEMDVEIVNPKEVIALRSLL